MISDKDTIYRQDAIDAVVELCKHYMPTKSVKHPHIDFVIEELNNVPSAPLERKKGKWQWCGNHHLCSECDEWALTRWDEDECDEVDILTGFCPNCGADMRKGEEE